MLSSINLNQVASYKNNVSLKTDKKINLIYGLNGAGKSTFSNYLHNRNDSKYKDCSIDGLDSDNEILVYNSNFIQDNFFETDDLKGIFTLSKENKDAEIKIFQAVNEIKKLEAQKVEVEGAFELEKNT